MRFRSRLVEIGWSLAGRDDVCPPVLPLVVEVIHAGSLIVDDIQDDSPSRRRRPALHRLYGLPLALNVGNWFYFWPFQLLPALELPADVELRAPSAPHAHDGRVATLAKRSTSACA